MQTAMSGFPSLDWCCILGRPCSNFILVPIARLVEKFIPLDLGKRIYSASIVIDVSSMIRS